MQHETEEAEQAMPHECVCVNTLESRVRMVTLAMPVC